MLFDREIWYCIFSFLEPGENCDVPVKIKQKYYFLTNKTNLKHEKTWLKTALHENPAAIYLLMHRVLCKNCGGTSDFACLCKKCGGDLNISSLCKNSNPESLKIISQTSKKYQADCIFILASSDHGIKFLRDNNIEIMPGAYSNLFKNPAAIDEITNILKNEPYPNSLKYLAANPAAGELISEQNFAFSDYYSLNSSDRIIDTLFKYPQTINWKLFSRNKNPRALLLLQQNIDKVHWDALASVKSAAAIKLIEENIHLLNEIAWECLSANEFAAHLIDKNFDKINVFMLAKNPCIFEIDGEKFYEKIFK